MEDATTLYNENDIMVITANNCPRCNALKAMITSKFGEDNKFNFVLASDVMDLVSKYSLSSAPAILIENKELAMNFTQSQDFVSNINI